VLTKLTIRNFKRFTTAEIELGNPVVFIGPNNSGKTTALQAIALWEAGLRRSRKNGGEGGTINRRDLTAVPIPNANLLWKDLHVQDVRIEIVVEGVTGNRSWTCGIGFEYANEESLYCRPLDNSTSPPEALASRVVFLSPMSGLADREFLKQSGEIEFLIGQGRTAEVLRNVCLRVVYELDDGDTKWQALVARMRQLFGIELDEPDASGIVNRPVPGWICRRRGAESIRRCSFSRTCLRIRTRLCSWTSRMRTSKSCASARSTT